MLIGSLFSILCAYETGGTGFGGYTCQAYENDGSDVYDRRRSS